MLMHTRGGTTIVTQQEKSKTKPNNRWTIYFCSLLCSFLSFVEKAYDCDGQFSFPHQTSQVEPNALLLNTFSKSSTCSWKNRQQTASWSLSWSFSPATIDFQNSPSFDFYMARDLSRPLATSSLAWPLGGLKSSLRSLRNSWNLIPR